MWHYVMILYLWVLMWSPGPPQGPNNANAHPDGQTVSGLAQDQDPNAANQAPGPNGYHSAYQGNSGSAPPNNP